MWNHQKRSQSKLIVYPMFYRIFNRGNKLKLILIIFACLYISLPIKAEISGDIVYGKKLADEAPSPLILQILLYKYLDSPKQLLRNGCEGCHELKTFEGNTKEEILDRILKSWHASGYIEDDLNDLTTYLFEETNKN